VRQSLNADGTGRECRLAPGRLRESCLEIVQFYAARSRAGVVAVPLNLRSVGGRLTSSTHGGRWECVFTFDGRD
jgi:hypothetical protein